MSAKNYGVPVPDAFSLEQNFPNPFNPATTISFTVPKPSYVLIEVYDVSGRKLTELVNSFTASGIHHVKFDPDGLTSGVYLYSMKINGELVAARRMLLIK